MPVTSSLTWFASGGYGTSAAASLLAPRAAALMDIERGPANQRERQLARRLGASHAAPWCHLHRRLHGADRRLVRRGALSRCSACRAPESTLIALAVADRRLRSTTPSPAGCATAPMSAPRSPTCRAAPPTSPARWPSSAGAPRRWKARATASADKARAATEPLVAELGELGTLVKQLAETVAMHEVALAAGKLAAVTSNTPRRRLRPCPNREPERWRRTRAAASAARRHRRRTRRDGRHDPRRDRSQPRRSLPAADRHAAAAQGALLRSADAAAHRGRHRCCCRPTSSSRPRPPA